MEITLNRRYCLSDVKYRALRKKEGYDMCNNKGKLIFLFLYLQKVQVSCLRFHYTDLPETGLAANVILIVGTLYTRFLIS
jgi:hypothetical protein